LFEASLQLPIMQPLLFAVQVLGAPIQMPPLHVSLTVQ
jgi:hypothetical protein